MRKLVLFMHTSLDGFVTDQNGGMDWIIVDDEIFDYGGSRIEKSDTAFYGRVTYEMMENYWPSAADQPNASKHDIQHSKWYNKAAKIVLSKSMKGKSIRNTTIISDNLAQNIAEIKKQHGTEILIFGSPSASHSLMQHNLIDEYWLFVNPVLIGAGTPLFKNISVKTHLRLAEEKVFKSGVVALHYVTSQH